MKKTHSFRGKTFYSLLAMFALLIFVLVCCAYLICYFALKRASNELETSLETILALQVQNIGASYSSGEYSDLETELAGNTVLAELAEKENIEYGARAGEAEALLWSYKESISYADLICYFYFEKSGYLMCTMLSGADASELAPDYVTEQLADFESMEIGASEKYLGVDGDGNYYDVCLIRLTSGVGLIRVSLGSPSYELPELFISNMTGVEMYTYDRYGNVHALEESRELENLYDYDSLGEADSDTFTFTSGGYSYIGSYYTFASRPIRLAVFCRDTAAENRTLSLRIILAAVLFLAFVCLVLAVLFAWWTYKPVEALVSRLPDEDRTDRETIFRDDFAIINRAFDQWTEQLREKDQMLQKRAGLEPDGAALQALSTAIASLSEEETLEQYDALIHQMTMLCGKKPDSEDMVFFLLVDTVALTILDFSLPGDMNRQMVRGYAQDIRQAENTDDLRASLLSALNVLNSAMEDEKEGERKRFADIRQYLQDNFRNPNLSASVIAERFHVSTSSLSRQFKKYNQTGFLEYLHRLRVTEAVRLLQETDLKVSEVAEKCGYTNVYTMNHAFKTYAGTTPGKYREIKRREI